MMKKQIVTGLTLGLLSTALMLNMQKVSAESFQTKDTPVENTKYKTIKNTSELTDSKLEISIKDKNRLLKVGDKVNEDYFLEGVTAEDSVDGDLTEKVTYTLATSEKTTLKSIKKIDTSKPTTYTVTYGVTNKEGVTATEASTITVTDDTKEPTSTRPELIVQDMDKVVEIGEKIDEKFILDGVKATDLIDGDLTSKITYTLSLSEADKFKTTKKIDTSKPDIYTVTYAVKNEAGITTTSASTIKVVDKVEEVEDNKLEIEMAYVVKTIAVGEPMDDAFILKGVTATDTIDKDLTDKVTYKAVFLEKTLKAKNVPVTKFDTSKAGTYTVSYTVENSSGKTASIEGQIEVLDKPILPQPKFAISVTDVGKIVMMGGKADDAFIRKGVTASDPVDGDLTTKITYKLSFVEAGSTASVAKDTLDTSKAGTYTVIYSAKNSAGETVTAEDKITVSKPVPAPTMTIKDPNKVVKVGAVIDENFIMAGVSAADETGKDITDKIMYTISFSEITVEANADENQLDTSVPGVYTITYVVANAAGGTATADGTITVVRDITTTTSTSSTTKPTGATTNKPTGKLPSTGEKVSSIAVTIFGIILLLGVLFKKRRMNG